MQPIYHQFTILTAKNADIEEKERLGIEITEDDYSDLVTLMLDLTQVEGYLQDSDHTTQVHTRSGNNYVINMFFTDFHNIMIKYLSGNVIFVKECISDNSYQ